MNRQHSGPAAAANNLRLPIRRCIRAGLRRSRDHSFWTINLSNFCFYSLMSAAGIVLRPKPCVKLCGARSVRPFAWSW